MTLVGRTCVIEIRYQLRSKLRSIILVATRVHVIVRSSVLLTWMRDTMDIV